MTHEEDDANQPPQAVCPGPNQPAKNGDPQDVAWWPVHANRDPSGRDEPFFYRPGQLLVRSGELESVERALRTKTTVVSLTPDPDQATGLMSRVTVAGGEPIPIIIRHLRNSGIGSEVVSPNHVFWPLTMIWRDSSSFSAQPWLSGGGESWPVEASQPPTPAAGSRGSGVTIAVFDSSLLLHWNDQTDDARRWLDTVVPARGSCDVGDGDDSVPGFDFYDSHATFVAGIVKCTAPRARIVVRDVLSEAGTVDDLELSEAIRTTVEADGTIKVINLSLGGTTMDNQPPPAMQALVNDYPNIVFVAAAGNNGPSGDRIWPAALNRVVGVGALDTRPGRPLAPAPFSNVNSADVWAPGVAILGAFGRGTLSYNSVIYEFKTGNARWSGTSFAAPLVAALLSEYISTAPANPENPVEWLRKRFGGAGNADVFIRP